MEVSGKRYLAFRGEVDVNAPKGRAGTLLLDPNDLCIGGTATSNSCGGTDASPTPEDTTAPFTAASADANSWVSTTTLSNLVTGNNGIDLQFTALNNIYFDADINLPAHTGRFQLNAGNDINMNNRTLTLGGNATSGLYFIAGNNIRVGTISAANRDVYLAGSGAITQTGIITARQLHLNFGVAVGRGGAYTLTQNNAVTSLWVYGGEGNVSFRDDTGFQIGRLLNTGTSRTITLHSAGAITQATDGTLLGAGTLLKQGAGTLTLSRPNNLFTGRLRIMGGRVHLTDSSGRALENGRVDFRNPSGTVARLTHSNNQTIRGIARGNANSSVEVQRGPP